MAFSFFAQRHFDMQTGGSGDLINNLLKSGRHSRAINWHSKCHKRKKKNDFVYRKQQNKGTNQSGHHAFDGLLLVS